MAYEASIGQAGVRDFCEIERVDRKTMDTEKKESITTMPG